MAAGKLLSFQLIQAEAYHDCLNKLVALNRIRFTPHAPKVVFPDFKEPAPGGVAQIDADRRKAAFTLRFVLAAGQWAMTAIIPDPRKVSWAFGFPLLEA